MKKCEICQKEFKNKMALAGHIAYHKPHDNGQTKLKKERKFKYEQNPKRCEECNEILSYEKAMLQKQKFCNHSCAAIYNNKRKIKKEKNKCLNCGKETRHDMFCNRKCLQEYKENERINLWLKTGSGNAGPHNYIRRYIEKEQENKCAICGIEPLWNNKPFTFILDHINGHNENNSRENLRLICPICDSQLDTYKSKNKGNGRKYRKKYYT